MRISNFFAASMRAVVRWGALFVASMALNELIAIYVLSRYAAVGWALVALWVLYDGSVVATELARVEALLAEEKKRCTEMRTCHMISTHIQGRLSDNHSLLCEIRQRIVTQGHVLKLRSSQLAGGSLPRTLSGNSL